METKRLFLAIPLSKNLFQKMAENREQYNHPDVRLTTEDNLHITIYFLGNIKVEDIAHVDQAIKQTITETQPFNLKFRHIAFAPPNRPPRMIWAEFFQDADFAKLSFDIYQAVKKYLDPASAACPEKNPIPHITLARFTDPYKAKNLKLSQIPQEQMPVEECHLMESRLSPRGSTYSILATYQFKNA